MRFSAFMPRAIPFSNLEYWRTCNDPEVRVVQLTFKPEVDEKRES